MGTFVTEDTQRIAQVRTEIVREAADRFLQKMKTLGVSPEEAADLIRKEVNEDA